MSHIGYHRIAKFLWKWKMHRCSNIALLAWYCKSGNSFWWLCLENVILPIFDIDIFKEFRIVLYIPVIYNAIAWAKRLAIVSKIPIFCLLQCIGILLVTNLLSSRKSQPINIRWGILYYGAQQLLVLACCQLAFTQVWWYYYAPYMLDFQLEIFSIGDMLASYGIPKTPEILIGSTWPLFAT